jgi:hypothetical protein
MLGRVAIVRTDVSEELRTSIIRVTRNGELGTDNAVLCSPNRVTLMMEELGSSETSVLTRDGATSQKTPFFNGGHNIASEYNV